MDVSDIASLCTFQITSFPEPNIPPPPPPAMVIQSSQSWSRPQQPDIAEQKKVPPSRPWQPPAKPAQTNHNDRDAVTKQESYEDWDDDDWDDDDDDDDSSVNTETSVSVNFEMVPCETGRRKCCMVLCHTDHLWSLVVLVSHHSIMICLL